MGAPQRSIRMPLLRVQTVTRIPTATQINEAAQVTLACKASLIFGNIPDSSNKPRGHRASGTHA